ncbi:MAG TPA: hypothetical protein P5275_04035 [Saprospiraceae bacterium]|nr:hypothetical protein [Saprospiraceae bacterium]MCB9272144.1 hypothetical protein [Lewinellaceae bacterium]HPG06471.1 hypothetical protein [Saprospiraceae bacterium]HPR01684.1 hypothetical protein [Saprospiraceae bacterium]HQU54767.1 hypothetical protein [Saprospiraceae bacterium]
MKTKSYQGICRIIISGLLAFLFTLSSFAQSKRMWVEINYMKSKSGDYESIETDVWKSIHQERIKQGDMFYWALYHVDYPSGTGCDYDYVTLNVYDNINDIEVGFDNWNNWVKNLPISQDVLDKTNESRDIVFTEVFELLAQSSEDDGRPPKFIVANRMQTDVPEAYVAMEKEIYQPVHRKAADRDMRKNWWLLQRFIPDGTEFGYNFITFDFYNNMNQLILPETDDLWENAHPQGDLYQKLANLHVSDMRTIVRRELWRMVDEAK